MPQKNSTVLATSKRQYQRFSCQYRPGATKRHNLIKNVGQGNQKGRHHRHLERHEEWRGDIGGDHLPALGQFGQQRMRQQTVEIGRPGKQADKYQ